LWSMVNGVSWAAPFAVVTFGPLHLRTVLVRCAALTCSFALLIVSGTAGYLYTLSQYTARVQFAATLDRPRGADFTLSALFNTPYMKYYYLVWVVGWLLGLVTLRGRSRLLVVAGILTAGAYLACVMIYLLLLNATWVFPQPVYIEQALFALF